MYFCEESMLKRKRFMGKIFWLSVMLDCSCRNRERVKLVMLLIETEKWDFLCFFLFPYFIPTIQSNMYSLFWKRVWYWVKIVRHGKSFVLFNLKHSHLFQYVLNKRTWPLDWFDSVLHTHDIHTHTHMMVKCCIFFDIVWKDKEMSFNHNEIKTNLKIWGPDKCNHLQNALKKSKWMITMLFIT